MGVGPAARRSDRLCRAPVSSHSPALDSGLLCGCGRPHLVGTELDAELVYQPRHLALTGSLADQAVLLAPDAKSSAQLASSAKASKPKPGSSAAALSAIRR